MGRGRQRPEIRDQRAELRPLQNLRHQGPESEHHLGSAGRQRRAELPEYVNCALKLTTELSVIIRANSRLHKWLKKPGIEFIEHAVGAIRRILPHVDLSTWEESDWSKSQSVW